MLEEITGGPSINTSLDEWMGEWYRKGSSKVHRRCLEFLELWRQKQGQWLGDVAGEFFPLTRSLDWRKFDWAEGFVGELQKLQFANLAIWHFEDEARRSDVKAEKIVELKRGIDAVNQKRNDQMERLDEYVLTRVEVTESSEVPLQSEPPGLILDRLTIMALKNYHYETWNQADETQILTRQRRDLKQAFLQLLEDLREGRRRVKIYRQLKTYNDPDKNPAL